MLGWVSGLLLGGVLGLVFKRLIDLYKGTYIYLGLVSHKSVEKIQNQVGRNRSQVTL